MFFLIGLACLGLLVFAWPLHLNVCLRLEQGAHSGHVTIWPRGWRWLQLDLPLELEVPVTDTLLPRRMSRGSKRRLPVRRVVRLSQVRVVTRAWAHLYRGITCHALSWHTSVGLRDAGLTALGTGFLWHLKTRAWLELCRSVRVTFTAPDFLVTPCFSTPGSRSDLECIFSCRLAHIIGVAIGGAWNLLRGEV